MTISRKPKIMPLDAEKMVFTADSFMTTTSLDLPIPERSVIFYEPYSGTYFKSTISRVLQAEYTLNRNYVLGDVITLNDWYTYLGLPRRAGGDDYCWDNCRGGCDSIYWIDFNHIVQETADGEYYIIEPQSNPMRVNELGEYC